MVALVILPGLDGTGLLLTDFVASLGPEIEVMVVSYPPDRILGYTELESIACSLLPIDQPFFLLAESFSGPIAISIAASSPPGLIGLILCCSFARNPMPLPALIRLALGIVPVAVVPMALLSFFVLGRFSSPMRRAALAKVVVLVAPAALRARACAALSVNVSALLSRINVPVLYLRASEDRVVTRSSSQLVVSLAPDTKVIEFTAPHFLLQVLPSLAASVVANFMDVQRGLTSPSK